MILTHQTQDQEQRWLNCRQERQCHDRSTGKVSLKRICWNGIFLDQHNWKCYLKFFLHTVSGAGTIFEQVGQKYNISYKIRFASKLPSICINQKYSMGVEPCAFSSHLTETGGWGRSSSRLIALGDSIPK